MVMIQKVYKHPFGESGFNETYSLGGSGGSVDPRHQFISSGSDVYIFGKLSARSLN